MYSNDTCNWMDASYTPPDNAHTRHTATQPCNERHTHQCFSIWFLFIYFDIHRVGPGPVVNGRRRLPPRCIYLFR